MRPKIKPNGDGRRGIVLPFTEETCEHDYPPSPPPDPTFTLPDEPLERVAEDEPERVRLRHEANRQRHPGKPKPKPQAEADETVRMIADRLSDIKMEVVTWLWDKRVPLKTVTVIFGDPGTGKSTLTFDLGARITRGQSGPDGAPIASGAVLFVSAEDAAASVIKPRLVAAGADPDKVHVHRVTRRKDPDRLEALGFVSDKSTWHDSHFTLADVQALRNLVRRIGEVRAVFLDPASAFVGAIDSHKNSSVRGLLAPLVTLAADENLALVLIDHATKTASTAPLYRMGGSIAWIAAARAAWIIAIHPDDTDKPDPDQRRVFTRAKCNLAPDPGGLAFKLVGERVPELGNSEVARVVWETGTVNVTAAQALAPVFHEPRETKADAAVDWLQGLLAHSPVPAKQGSAQAEAQGFKPHTLLRARERLGVATEWDDKGQCWLWSLQKSPLQQVKSSTHQDINTSIDINKQQQQLLKSRSIEVSNSRSLDVVKSQKGTPTHRPFIRQRERTGAPDK